MLTITIPQGAAFFQQRVELEGVSYTFDFAWVARARTWALAILSDEGVLALSGIAIVANRPLLSRFHHLAVPPGELFFIDATGLVDAPAFDTLSELVYVTEEEWDARNDA